MRNSRKQQRGVTMIDVALALIISAIAATVALRANVRAQELETARLQGQTIKEWQDAINIYTFENYTALQMMTPVVRGAYTVPAGAGAGQSLGPSVADLVGLGYLPANFGTNFTNNGTLRVQLQRVPAGCAGAACQITGIAYLDRPILMSGGGEPNGPAIGAMMAKIGSNSVTSLIGATANMVGLDGFTLPNPVPGQPAGVVAARVGFDASGFGQFLRVADTRDPNFQGPMTVAGDTTLSSKLGVTGDTTLGAKLDVTGDATLRANAAVTGNVVAGGDVGSQPAGAACLRAALNANGEILSRAASCVTKFLVSPVDGSATAANSGGIGRAAIIGDTGRVEARSAAGVTMASLDGTDGRVGAQMLNPAATGSAGTSCAGFAEGDLVKDSAVDGTVLSCRSGIWRRPGINQSSAGAACSTDGAVAIDGAGRGLICRSGVWRLINDRVASVVAIATFGGNGSGFVPAPACGTGGNPEITVTPLETGADYGGVPPRNRYSIGSGWTGSGWNIDPALVDQSGGRYGTAFDGSSYSFAWIATTICNYGVNS